MKKKPVKKAVKKPRAPRRSIVKKTRNAGTMTESQFFSKLRSALRNAFRWWKPMQEALNQASRPSQNKKNLRLKKEYQCAHCKNWFSRKDVEIDHILEAGSLKSYEDVVPFIQRLVPENIDAFQILCKKICHPIKTKLYLETKRIIK